MKAPEILELNISPSSPVMNLTFSGLDVEVELIDASFTVVWGLIDYSVQRLTLKNLTIQGSFLEDYTITQANFSLGDFSLKMGNPLIEDLLNDSWHGFALEQVNIFF